MQYTQGMLREGAMEGKTVIVTGGGTGLGRSMTKYMLELGAKVVITSRRQEVLDQAAKELHAETGGVILPIACDVREQEHIENVIQTTVKEFGSFNGLLNNAAGNFISPTERLSPNAFNTVLDIVLKGTAQFTLAAGKYWIDNKIPASVLNIVTTYAWTGSAFVVPSSCAKAGVLAMTRSLAAEWGKYQIRNNAIAPGPFPTEGAWSRLLPGDLAKKWDPALSIPLKRVGEHQELANLAAYLMSEYSAYVNGEVITIDGGEWVYGAGEFNKLDKLPEEMWDLMDAARKKNTSKLHMLGLYLKGRWKLRGKMG
ncbi:MAG TPA: short-chain dehydrogenase [Cytophagales bacterium]|nr:short-chain dehydrogenase [Cytophagales bacterium]HAA20830.1 short-chain dehydrogenase [Cytophagales bacterium]